MSKSIRFLGVAILAWAGVRAISLGIVPGTEALAFDASSAGRRVRLPPIEQTFLPPIDPVSGDRQPPQMLMSAGVSAGYPAHTAYPGIAPFPVYVPVHAAAGRSAPPQIIYVNPPAAEPRGFSDYGTEAAPAEQPDGLAMLVPPASSTARTLSSVTRVCSARSSDTIAFVTGSSGPCPDTNRNPPTFTP